MFDWHWLFTQEAQDYAKIVGAVIPAASALLAVATLVHGLRIYHKSVLDKNTDISLKIEESYRKELGTLLACEYMPEYNRSFLPALNKSILACQRRLLDSESVDYCLEESFTKEESQAIDRIESMLRHFFHASITAEANKSVRSLLELHRYYLALFVRGEQPNAARADLRDYIQVYWPAVFEWGLALQHDRPWYRRWQDRSDPLAVHRESVEQRAFELHVIRAASGNAGSPDVDWREAETELRSRVKELLATTEARRSDFRKAMTEIRNEERLQSRWISRPYGKWKQRRRVSKAARTRRETVVVNDG